MHRPSQKTIAKCIAALFVVASGATSAADLVWASSGDILTFDIHSQNETLNAASCANVYEPLVQFDEHMKVVPALATSWKRVPEGFLFEIRQGVKFHEGQILTPEDVVFSIRRAIHPKSQFKASAAGILDAQVASSTSVLLKTNTGSPVILNQLVNLLIMNKSWAEKNKVLEPQDYIKGEESYAAHHANGTGPFILKSREVDTKTVFTANTAWWNQANRKGNVTQLTYRPIKSGSTRTASLLSGDIDLVIDPAPQDISRLKKEPAIRIAESAENRAMMISLDQFRDKPLYVWDNKGEPLSVNPFKDHRVREALLISVNREGLVRGVMRGSAVATGTIITSNVNGWNKEAAALPEFNNERAKKLLAEAGYPNGFSFELVTPNNRWINDENICKALASMWAKIGVTVKVNSMPRAKFFPKVLSFDSSAALVGWGASTFDGLYPIQCLSATYEKASGNGISNIGRASNAEIDRLLKLISVEENVEKRNGYLKEVLAIEKKEILHIPLHEQTIAWAMRKNVEVVPTPNNRVVPDRIIVR